MANKKLLDAVTGVGASDSLFVRDGFRPMTVSFSTTGGPATISVDLEGTLDGTNWFVLGVDTTVGGAMFHVVDKAVNYVRINLSTLTGGTSPTVTAWFTNGTDLQ